MGIGILMWICNTINLDPTVKNCSTSGNTCKPFDKNRTSSLMNLGYGTESKFHNGEDLDHEQKCHESSFVLGVYKKSILIREVASLMKRLKL